MDCFATLAMTVSSFLLPREAAEAWQRRLAAEPGKPRQIGQALTQAGRKILRQVGQAATGAALPMEAISGKTVGSEKLWMGETHVAASTSSGDHHHGEPGDRRYEYLPTFFLRGLEALHLDLAPA